MNSLKDRIKLVLEHFGKKSFSQEGEDMVLERIYEHKFDGFYVDVGAHHPMRFSNTYHFYKKGWRGINIDGLPGSMENFNKYRKGDINIETLISDNPLEYLYYQFEEPALNTIDQELGEKRIKEGQKLIARTKLKSSRLDELLSTHLSNSQKIDILSVDVEGHDLQVLQSNNWNLYRPEFIIAELLECDFTNYSTNVTASYLISNGYQPYAKCVHSWIFKRL